MGVQPRYLPAYRDSFILDDFKQIEFIAPLVKSPLEAYQVVNPFWIRWYYRPVEHWAFLLGRLAFGLEPRGYYVGLISLHAANVALVYVVARKLDASRFGSLCAAALFAVNARHQNVIGWISSVPIATAALGALGCVACYIVFLGDRRRHGMLVATIALWMFALLSREENLVLPLVLVGIRWLYLRASATRPSGGVCRGIHRASDGCLSRLPSGSPHLGAKPT